MHCERAAGNLMPIHAEARLSARTLCVRERACVVEWGSVIGNGTLDALHELEADFSDF